MPNPPGGRAPPASVSDARDTASGPGTLGEAEPPPKTQGAPDWIFAGWGHATRLTDLESAAPAVGYGRQAPTHKLGQWSATAICGNDITSSVLYVAALCTLAAGVYAPIALAMVGLVLYLFRRIYAEVGSALPLNGGAYNVLLNTTSKGKASVAACLTLLSYVATAVISANEATLVMLARAARAAYHAGVGGLGSR